MRVAENIKRKTMAKDIKQYPHQTPRNVGKGQRSDDVIIIVEGRAPIFMVFYHYVNCCARPRKTWKDACGCRFNLLVYRKFISHLPLTVRGKELRQRCFDSVNDSDPLRLMIFKQIFQVDLLETSSVFKWWRLTVADQDHIYFLKEPHVGEFLQSVFVFSVSMADYNFH